MNGQYHQNQTQPKKDMYIISLDLTRVFWIIAISLFFLTFFFLFGYWLGSDSNYLDTQKDRLTHKSNGKRWLTVNKDELRKAYEEEKAKVLGRESFNRERYPVQSKDNRPEKLSQKGNQLFDRNERQVRNYQDSQRNDFFEPGKDAGSPKRIENPKDVPMANNRTRPIELRRYVRQPKEKPNKVSLSSKDRHLSKKQPYTIQVSTHRVKSNAYRLQRKLRKNYPAYVFAKSRSKGKVSYFVRVGPYATEDKAHKMQIKLLQVKEARNSIVVNK